MRLMIMNNIKEFQRWSCRTIWRSCCWCLNTEDPTSPAPWVKLHYLWEPWYPLTVPWVHRTPSAACDASYRGIHLHSHASTSGLAGEEIDTSRHNKPNQGLKLMNYVAELPPAGSKNNRFKVKDSERIWIDDSNLNRR